MSEIDPIATTQPYRPAAGLPADGSGVSGKLSTVFRVGVRRCSMTYSAAGLAAEWEPDVPTQRLTKSELRDYRRGRDAFVAEIARHIGGNVLLVE